MKFYDNDTKRYITEKEIRELDFEENYNDLVNNKNDIIEGIISIESVCENIENSLNGDIENVVEDLNKCWGYDINIWEKKV